MLSSFAASLMGWACPAMANTATMDAMTMIQQNGIVKGVVTDTQGEPIIGATVMVKNATNATVTDLNGTFTLSDVSRGTLVISYVGYLNREVVFRSGQTLNITLAEDTKALEEVVVVGYGTQKKATLTGAVASTMWPTFR